MLSGEDVRGVLAVQTYTEAVSFSEADQNLLSFVGTHILNALERHRARVELERQVAERTRELAETNEDLHQQVRERERGERLQKALFKVAELSGHDGSLVDFCSALHVIVADLMPASNFYLAMLAEDGRSLSFPYYMDEMQPRSETRAIGRGLTEYVIRQAQPILIDAARTQELVALGEVEVNGVAAESWLAAPLICTRGVMGVLVVQSYSEKVVYGERERELLMFVAYQVANGMQRRRAAEDLRKANAMLELRVEERTRELRRQIEERELIQAKLKHQVLHDTLTGLPNRDLLRERLDRSLQRLQGASGLPFALLFIDVDRFKVINDSLGHQAGDAVLIEIARASSPVCAIATSSLACQATSSPCCSSMPRILKPRRGWRSESSKQLVSRCRFWTTPCSLRSASGLRSRMCTIAVQTTCCAMPMRRCIAPKSRAAIAIRCFRRSWITRHMSKSHWSSTCVRPCCVRNSSLGSKQSSSWVRARSWATRR
jgi:GAF domain-containing protein